MTEFSMGITPGSEPFSITVGPDGALWFTELAGGRIGRITTAGTVTEYSKGITPGEQPNDIAAGPHDALWFTESTSAGGALIGRVTTSGKISDFRAFAATLHRRASPKGADGNIWFVETNTNRVARVNS